MQYSTASDSDRPSSAYASPQPFLPRATTSSSAARQGPEPDADHADDDDDDDEEAWDEVDIPQAALAPDGADGAAPAAGGSGDGAADGGGIEIVIARAGAKAKGKGKAKAGETARERMVRQERHKVHVLTLVAVGLVRNKWLNDKELQARLVSLVPAQLLANFTSISPARYPNPRDRSRLFDRALADLVSWWYAAFELVDGRELRRRGVDEVDEEVEGWRAEGEKLREIARRKRDRLNKAATAASETGSAAAPSADAKGKGKAKDASSGGLTDPSLIPLYPWDESPLLTSSQRTALVQNATTRLPLHPSTAQLVRPFLPAASTWEVLRAPAPGTSAHLTSLYAAAASLRGSRDLSAQLLCALLRAVDVPARLVISLQAVEWRSKAQSGAAQKKKRAGEAKAKKGKTKGKAKGTLPARRKAAPAKDSEFDFTTDDEDDDEAARKAAAAVKRRKKPPAESAAPGRASKASSAGSGYASSPAAKPRASASAAAGSTKKPKVETLVLSSASDTDGSAGGGGGGGGGSTTDGSWEDGRGKLAYKVPKVNLRKSAGAKGKSGAKVPGWKKDEELRRGASPDAVALATPPTQWIEAYTRYNKEWITVDPVRRRIRCKGIMEPPRASARSGGEGNVLAYVVAFEEDGSAHDVTPRYARAFTNVTLKLRVPTSTKQRKENGGGDWFAGVMQPWKRKFVLNRDRDEEQELWNRSANEPFPTSIGGFKNHPNYVLEQHLHRDEALRPGARDYGLFKGEHKVYRRADVVVVKSQENWYRQGRTVKDNEIPMKFVKQRAVTINRRREEELAKMDGGEVDEQPLFSEEQTQVYVPPSVTDGKVPKNSFGNIDLFVPTMLPEGAVHLPSKVAIKCAKELGIDHAEAITGFEFRQRRALPVMAGVVVAEENADVLREAIVTLEQTTFERELAKQQDRVLKRWKKLIQGLRIRQRLLDQFKDPAAVDERLEQEKKAASKSRSKASTETPITSAAASPAPAPASPPAASLTVKPNGSTTRSSAAPSSSRKRRASPASPPAQSASEEDADFVPSTAAGAPPPRKRLAPSTNTTAAPPEPRKTRSSAASTAGAAPQTSGISSSGRSLRVRMPVKQDDDDEDEEVQERLTGRPTRTSAQKARGRLAVKEEDSEGEGGEDDELAHVREGEPALDPSKAEGGGADESDDGFEYEEDF
ncbi:hypothetical protein Rhopal_007143-T1 [Rhodotorula paludigena]|uniref:Rad4-domain-containing protein n=1 Tax=Rhodotorula paludigena TaxID=86838 RepID=A0AAV5GVT4_9BASI|nr:hypothetical protein Rhopal_007143-T1 [Rhodotorula paludigena]